MSAIAPNATELLREGNGRKWPIASFRPVANKPSFDQFVGYSITLSASTRTNFWDCKSERLGSLEIDHQFEFRRRLHGKVTCDSPFKNSINIGDWLPYHID